MKKIAIIIAMICIAQILIAQKVITGQVIEENGTGIPGALSAK